MSGRLRSICEAAVSGHLLRHSTSGLFHALAEIGSARIAPPRDARAAAHRLAGALGLIARAHDIAVVRSGQPPRTTSLLVANHVSYLDPLAVLPLAPAIPVAKGEIASWPIIGQLATQLGVLLLARDQPVARCRMLRRIADLLGSGISVLNFPEGTTTDGNHLMPFWRGSFGIAQRLGVPVIPVAIRYSDPRAAWFGGACFLPHYVRTARLPGMRVDIEFGAPIEPRAQESAQAMATRTRNTIAFMLERSRHAGQRDDLSATRSDPVLSSVVGDPDRRRGRRHPRRAA